MLAEKYLWFVYLNNHCVGVTYLPASNRVGVDIVSSRIIHQLGFNDCNEYMISLPGYSEPQKPYFKSYSNGDATYFVFNDPTKNQFLGFKFDSVKYLAKELAKKQMTIDDIVGQRFEGEYTSNGENGVMFLMSPSIEDCPIYIFANKKKMWYCRDWKDKWETLLRPTIKPWISFRIMLKVIIGSLVELFVLSAFTWIMTPVNAGERLIGAFLVGVSIVMFASFLYVHADYDYVDEWWNDR